MSNDNAFTGSVPEIYDRFMGPMLFEPFARELAGRFAGFSGDLLETAAGTGRVTRALAEAAPNARVTATDVNAAMLSRAAILTSAPNIAWRAADAQALPFAKASFDAVACQFGVMFFPDKAAGCAEARRVLRPAGRYVFSVWDDIAANDISDVAQAALKARFPKDPPTFYERTPFGWHDEVVIGSGLRVAGFTGVKIETVRLPTPTTSALDAATGLCLGSPMRGEIEARDPDGLEAAVQATAQAIADHFTAGDLDRPFAGVGQALVVTAKA